MFLFFILFQTFRVTAPLSPPLVSLYIEPNWRDNSVNPLMNKDCSNNILDSPNPEKQKLIHRYKNQNINQPTLSHTKLNYEFTNYLTKKEKKN
jgi:hypothetical protein